MFGFGKKKIQNKVSTHKQDFYAGNDINNDNNTQMKLSTVYRCVEVLSNSMSKMPFFIIDTGTHKKPSDSTSMQIKYLLNSQPNKIMSSSIFLKLMETNRLLTGNAYALIKTDNLGKIESLQALTPSGVTVKQLDDRNIVYDVMSKNKGLTRYLSEEIIHIKGATFDGIIGQSVLSYASLVTRNLLLQEQFEKEFYESGGRPVAIIQPTKESKLSFVKKNELDKPDPNGKSDYDRLREEVEKISSKRIGGAVIFPVEANYTPIQQISMRDMSFIEAKEVGVKDIARFFGVPLFKLFDGKESYQSNEQNGIAYVTDTLTPILTQYEQEFTRKLLSEERIFKGYSIKGNLNNEMRGDLSTRDVWYKGRQETGVYSINEVRALEDQEAIDGGDVHYISLNYAPIDKHAEWWEARIEQANDSHLEKIGESKEQKSNHQNKDGNRRK